MKQKFNFNFLVLPIILVGLLGLVFPAKAFYLEVPDFFVNALQVLKSLSTYAQEAPPPITPPPTYTPPPSEPPPPMSPPPVAPPPPDNYTPPPTNNPPPCSPPPGGCMGGANWNQRNCSCEGGNMQPPMSCTPPMAGCGMNMMWDQQSCMCKSSGGGCTPPLSGCPFGTWNQSTCTCQGGSTLPCGGMTPPSCTPPSNSVCENNVWRCSSGVGCTPPASGCGTGNYWEPTSCSCKPNGSPVGNCAGNPPYCSAPSYSACENGAWQCKSGNHCMAPVNGCGMNSYWEPVSCSCKPNGNTGTCTGTGPSCGMMNGAPAYPFCENGAWRCPSNNNNNNNNNCMAPMSGCGMGMMWDQPSCTCKSSNANNGTCTGTSPNCTYPAYPVCENNAWRCRTTQTNDMSCGDGRGNPTPRCADGTCSCYSNNTPACPGPNCLPINNQPAGMIFCNSLGRSATPAECADADRNKYNQPEQMNEQTKCSKGGGNWCGNYCSWGGGKCETMKTYQIPTMEMNTNQMNPQDEQRYIKDMQRGAKDMDRGLKQLENMIKQSAKKGITISPEMQTNTEKMRLMIDSVKNAKTATELQNVDMGEISQMMMELDNSRRDLENNTRRLDDTKRNIKDAERGITQFERQLKKAGSCVSEEIKEKLAALKASISTIKNAKTWAEVEAAGLEDMGDLFMSLDENRQVLEVCGRWPQMSKEMDKQLKSLNNQLKSAKTITTRLSKRNIDISSQFASFEAAVQKMQTVRDEVKELMTSGDAEGAMNLLEENFFGQMDDVMQYSRVIQMMSGVGQFTTEFKKGITQAKTQINKLKKSRIDVTELNEILAEAQSKGNEILAIMKAGNFDADEVISMIEDLEQNRLNFEDKIADLTGTEREIMPWESGNQIFNRVEMPTFLNAYMRPQESQTMPMMQGPMGPNTGSANPIGESNPQPSPGPTNTLAPGTY